MTKDWLAFFSDSDNRLEPQGRRTDRDAQMRRESDTTWQVLVDADHIVVRARKGYIQIYIHRDLIEGGT